MSRPNVSARLTATIDAANTMLLNHQVMPIMIEKVALEADSRIATVFVRFEDGTWTMQVVASAMLSPVTLVEAAIRAYLLDFIGVALAVESEGPGLEVDAIGYATGALPSTTVEVTHGTPERVQ